MQRLEVRDRVLESIELTPWESGTVGERSIPRWWVFLRYATVDASRAGFMEKESGHWSITPKGVQAVESMSPLDLFQAARDGYEEWRSEQEDDDENDEIDNQVEVKWTRPYIFHAGLNLLSRSPGQQMDRDLSLIHI